jgi:uncharacterized membrane protein YdbT with pleckstrin-like domain
MRYLLPTEVPVVFVRRHPIVLLRYLVEVVVAGLVCGTVARGLSAENDDVVWWLFLAVVARAIWMAMEWHNDRFLVTDRRIMLVSGLLTRKVAMMPLIKVTDLTFERPLVGRLLGYGTFVLESAGQDQALRRIGYLPAPDVLYRDVSQLIFGPGKIAARRRPRARRRTEPPGSRRR